MKRSFRLPFGSSGDAGKAVDEELAFHMELCVEELAEEGWSPEEARAEAVRRFGDLDGTRHYCVDLSTRREKGARRVMRFEEIRQDLTYAWRTLRQNRGFSAVVIVTLALGIAANTTIFSLMNPYLFRALPFGDADQLVQVGQVDPVEGWDGGRFSLPMFNDWEARQRSFSGLGFYSYGIQNVTGPEGPERIMAGNMSANMFDVLDTDPALGRTFLPEEGGPGGEDVVVLDNGLWQRRYAGDPGILGRTITLDGVAFTVIGVMPPDFNFPFGEVKMWIPERDDPAGMDRALTGWLMVGRLAEGVTPERARQDLLAIQTELAEVYPDADGGFSGVSVKPMREALNFAWDVMQAGFLVLLAAVGFVLLIACVNVASLTLARASTRTREVAVRAAIGASKGRIVRQLFTESLLMAAMGGALGVALTYGVTQLIGPQVPEGLFKIGGVSVDGTVLAFTLVVTLLTPLIFGLAPAMATARTNLADAIKEGSQGGGDRKSLKGRRALVVVEVVLAIVLISGTGLMIRSFMEVQSVDLGFHNDELLTVEVTLPQSDYPGADEQAAYFDQAVMEAEAIAGVVAVGTVYPLPLNHENIPTQVAVPGREPATPEDWPSVLYARAGAGYFESMGVPVLAGREFDAGDGPDSERLVIVSRSFAQTHWPQESSPLGQTLLYGDPGAPSEATVVGVVGDVQAEGVATAPRSHLYRPMTQVPVRRRFLTVHTSGDPGAMAPQVRQALNAIDPNLPITLRPMNEIVVENTFVWSLGSVFLGIFGLVALLLAALGIYGVISYSVARRQREIGLRMALGASGGQIRGIVVGEGLKLTGIGMGVGMVLALLVGQVMTAVLFGVSPFDPVTLGTVLVLFLVVSLVASLLPALRAGRVDPLGVLKAE